MAEPAYNFQAMLRRFQSGELLEELCGIRQRMEKNLAEAVRLGDETRGMGMRLLPQPAKLGAIDPRKLYMPQEVALIHAVPYWSWNPKDDLNPVLTAD